MCSVVLIIHQILTHIKVIVSLKVVFFFGKHIEHILLGWLYLQDHEIPFEDEMWCWMMSKRFDFPPEVCVVNAT